MTSGIRIKGSLSPPGKSSILFNAEISEKLTNKQMGCEDILFKTTPPLSQAINSNTAIVGITPPDVPQSLSSLTYSGVQVHTELSPEVIRQSEVQFFQMCVPEMDADEVYDKAKSGIEQEMRESNPDDVVLGMWVGILLRTGKEGICEYVYNQMDKFLNEKTFSIIAQELEDIIYPQESEDEWCDDALLKNTLKACKERILNQDVTRIAERIVSEFPKNLGARNLLLSLDTARSLEIIKTWFNNTNIPQEPHTSTSKGLPEDGLSFACQFAEKISPHETFPIFLEALESSDMQLRQQAMDHGKLFMQVDGFSFLLTHANAHTRLEAVKTFMDIELCRHQLPEVTLRYLVDIILSVDEINFSQQFGSLPLSLFFDVKEYLREKLQDSPIYRRVIVSLKNKQFSSKIPEHILISYLLLLYEPHAMKYLKDYPFFCYKDCIQIAKNNVRRSNIQLIYNQENPTLHLITSGETAVLAYEAYLFKKEILEPALDEASRQGKTIMLVANVTGGGTGITALPFQELQEKNNIKVVFTKQASSPAHNDKNVLEENLFTSEELRYILEYEPWVIVADVSRNHRYPDAFRGYRNFFMVLDQARGIDVDSSDFQIGPDIEELKETKKAKLLSSKIQKLNTKSRQVSITQGYRIFYHSPTRSLKVFETYTPPVLDWSKVHGPSLICVQTAIEDLPSDNTPQANLVRKNMKGQYHRQAAFDDCDEYQQGHLYLSNTGLKIRPIVHWMARRFFKIMVQNPIQYSEGLHRYETKIDKLLQQYFVTS